MLREERHDEQKYREVAEKTKLKGLVQNLKGTNIRLILLDKITGAWMSLHGTKVSGTVLSATEFWDFLCARYNVYLLNPQIHCYSCGTTFGAKQ